MSRSRPDWPQQYARVGAWLRSAAPRAALTLTGFSACVDAIHPVRGPGLEALAAQASRGPGAGPGARLAAEIMARIASGRDGEIAIPFPGGDDWVAELLGPPDRLQIGGTGPQASWSLAVLGARSVLALADRSAAQLGVLHPDVLLCTGAGLVPAGAVPAAAGAGKPRHPIIEFAAGTRWSRGVVGRSSRLILRFADDGIERDEDFAAATAALVPRSGAGLVSGLNGVPPRDRASRDWLRAVVAGWRLAGLPVLHHELAEFPDPAQLVAACELYAGLAGSIGLSQIELRTLSGGEADPAARAIAVAERFGAERVCVHADRWALSVHRGDPAAERDALLAGCLLAAVRAAGGRPGAELTVPNGAALAADRPASGPLPGGWRADCVPSPYLPDPVGTVGLGDTFVAGCLLAQGLAVRGEADAVAT